MRFLVYQSGLISEGILYFVPLATKGAKSLPCAENLNFSPITVSNLFKSSAQWNNLALFVGNGTKVKIPSEIKPPLTGHLRPMKIKSIRSKFPLPLVEGEFFSDIKQPAMFCQVLKNEWYTENEEILV